MERILTQEERIRRAEEIYLRRKSSKPQYRETKEIPKSKTIPTVKNMKLFKRMALQMVICLLLYCVFYLIYDTNYSFSDTTINKTQEILNYDINFDEIYKYISENVMSFINIKGEDEVKENKSDNIEDNNQSETNNEQDNTNEGQQNEDVVNNVITPPQEEPKQEEIPQQVEQTSAVEPDLKQMYSLINPVKRRILYILRIWSKRVYL